MDLFPDGSCSLLDDVGIAVFVIAGVVALADIHVVLSV